MRAFEYASPQTKEQAVQLLGASWDEAQVLAGGTDLLSLMKDEITNPKRLVNIKEIKELDGISMSARTGLRLGATATIQEIVDNAQLRRAYPAIWAAADGITSPQIRNMGTVAGDLCQRPRCWYYRNGFGLLAKDESGESLVATGDNRYHAILGNQGPAYFVSPSSLAPALIAYNAKIRIFGPGGQREVPAENFFRAPASENEREHDLKPNEIVTEIVVAPAGMARAATYEVREKLSLDWPLATASVVLGLAGNRVRTARVVLGHVAPTPWRSREAEEAIIGKAVTEQTAQAAGEAAVAGARSLGHNRYKIQLARVAVKRALLEAARGGLTR